MNDSQESILELIRSFSIRCGPYRVVDLVDALTVFRGNHITALTQALTDPDDEVRLLAVEILGEMGDDAEEALPVMIDTLRDPDRICRIACVDPVASFGHKAIAAIPILETWLDCGDEFSEVTAAGAILRITPIQVDDVLPVLVDALDSDDYGIRCNSVWHLGQLGSVAKDSVPALRRMLDEEPSSLRRLAHEAIASITGEGL